MKIAATLLVSILFAAGVSAQTTSKPSVSKPDPSKKIQVVEASCGECNFKMDGIGCHLAVRIDGKTYFVQGTGINDHGDAHAHDGFCEAVRKAEVQGEVVNNKFQATYFKLIPVEKPKKTTTTGGR